MIVVVGSVNADIVATVAHLPAAGETVIADGLARTHGGKGANQAVAAARLGASVSFVGGVGADPDGDAAVAALIAEGVDTHAVAVTDCPTGTAIVTVDASGENTIAVVPGANHRFTIREATSAVIAGADVLLVQLEVPMAVVRDAITAASGRVILNAAPAAPVPRDVLDRVDILVVNEPELGTLAGGTSPQDARSLGVATVVATFGDRGAQVVTTGDVGTVRAMAVTPIDTTGAGDTFCGALAARIHDGDDVFAASAFAAVAGSLATMRVGARSGMPSAEAVRRAMGGRT